MEKELVQEKEQAKVRENHNLWDDYLVIGLAVAILLTILDYSKDSFYQIIPVVVLFFITGFKENCKALAGFCKRYWFFGAVTLGYLLYYMFIDKNATSAKFVAAMFFVTLGGFILVMRSGGEQVKAYRKLWVMLLSVLLLGIVKVVVDFSVGYFMSYQIELGAAVIFAVITFFYLDDRKLQIAGVAVSLCSAALSFKFGGLSLFHNLMAIKGILPIYSGGGIRYMLFGQGLLAAQDAAPDFTENTFAVLLYDYGFIMFAMYLSVLVFAVVMVIKTDDNLLKKQAALVCVMILMSAGLMTQYWGNIIFLIWSGIGVMLGRAGYGNEKAA